MARRLIANIDRPLLVTVAVLVLLGLYNLASAGKPLGANLHQLQAANVGVGIVLMILAASFHYRHYESLALVIFLSVLALLIATDLFGKTVNGSRRWLPVGPVNVQTSDLAKLSVIIILARALHVEHREPGGLTLRDIFRPFNVSRPFLLVVGVLIATTMGDGVRPASLQRIDGLHSRTLAKLKESSPVVVIGRGKDAAVQLPMLEVLDRHAELLRLGDGHYLVRDFGSEAGTFVNGERVVGERRIHDKDVVRLGLSPRAEMQFRAPMERFRSARPYVALLGLAWLVASVVAQLKKKTWSLRDLVAPIDYVVLPAVLILVQPDLGTALISFAIAFSMFLYVGFRPVSLLLFTLFSIAGGVLAWLSVLKPYQKQRVLTFLNPTSDLAGAGYHQHQALIAIGSGQMSGKGHGQGTQTQLSFLPEQQTDFIFAVWSEEHGFIGCIVVVMLFCVLVLLSIRIAAQARDRFGALLAVGVTSMVFWHVVINMLMVLRLLPVVGVPLPLFSNGGSFVVTVLIGIGILLNVGMRRFVF